MSEVGGRLENIQQHSTLFEWFNKKRSTQTFMCRSWQPTTRKTGGSRINVPGWFVTIVIIFSWHCGRPTLLLPSWIYLSHLSITVDSIIWNYFYVYFSCHHYTPHRYLCGYFILPSVQCLCLCFIITTLCGISSYFCLRYLSAYLSLDMVPWLPAIQRQGIVNLV